MSIPLFASSSQQEEQLNNKRTPEEFYEVLHSLFKELDLLDYEIDNVKRSKFAFTEAYPDNEYNQNNVVTYHVMDSVPFVASSSTTRKDTTYHKAVQVNQYTDKNTGDVIDLYVTNKKHCIELRCFSVSSSTCRQLANLVESVFNTHSNVLKKYIKDFRYLTTTQVSFLGEYDNKRLFTVAVFFEIYTSVHHTANLEQIRQITLKFK